MAESAIKTATMVLYMTEVDEVVYTETPEYGMDSFLSDVGGTAGKKFTCVGGKNA